MTRNTGFYRKRNLSRSQSYRIYTHLNTHFVLKTAKKTLYCDRIIKDGKTCKIWGPILKHKLQAQNKKVVEEYDRAKQKMYKRYERATDPNKKVSEKDLTYEEYYDWLEKATQARDDYLAGKLTAEEALKIIKVP